MSAVEFSMWQPTRPLSVNESNRLHWAERRRRLEDWHWGVLANWGKIRPRPEVGFPITVQVTLTFPRKARRDAHNYTGTNVKRIVDTLVQTCRVVPDDTPEWVTVLDPIIRIADDNLATVRIERRDK